MSIGSSVALITERIVEPVEGMHRTISRRWFGAVGPPGRPIQQAHDLIAGLVYGAIRLGGDAVGLGVDAAMGADAGSGTKTRAFVNGLWGDDLGRHAPRLAMSMSLRTRGGEPWSRETAATPSNHPTRMVVLIHGLGQTEDAWSAETGLALFDRLEAHPTLTPVAARYNTGLPVATNARELTDLLEEISLGPSGTTRPVALVGHSMGGLVARGAVAEARATGHRWVDDLADVITIGTPHRGAPAEQLAKLVSDGLAVARSTRPLAAFVDRRSRGIKDLRSGAIGHGDDASPSHERLDSIDYHFIAGTITSDERHPLGRLLGDAMVRVSSAVRPPGLRPTSTHVEGGVDHFHLLEAPGVVGAVMDRLGAR